MYKEKKSDLRPSKVWCIKIEKINLNRQSHSTVVTCELSTLNLGVTYESFVHNLALAVACEMSTPNMNVDDLSFERWENHYLIRFCWKT